MSDLDARLARGPLRVRSLWSATSLEAVAARIDRRRRWSLLLDVAVACACVALLVLVPASWRRPASSAQAGIAQVVFADGSVAELSTRDTELHIEQDSPSGSVARLTGGARFQVVPNHTRTFEVRAGDVRVRVLGTTFSVQQLPAGQTQVLVEHGRVEVAWLGGATVLQAGQGGVFPPSATTEEADVPDDSATASKPAPPPPPSARPAGSAPGTDGWRKDARAGDYGRAYEELNTKGADAVRDDAGDLMLAADIARLSGHPEESLRPLRAVCERHAGDRRAPVAAFTLGRVLDDLGRPADAAAAFQKARVLWPAGPLTEDALSREADAWLRAGRPDGARTAAGAYIDRYPKGRHVPAMRKILGQ